MAFKMRRLRLGATGGELKTTVENFFESEVRAMASRTSAETRARPSPARVSHARSRRAPWRT